MSEFKKNHQDFQITQSEKLKLIRQDRIDCDSDRVKFVINDEIISDVINVSTFGIALASNKSLNAEYFDGLITVDNYPVASVNIKKIRETNATKDKIETAFMLFDSSIDSEVIFSIKNLNDILKDQVTEISNGTKIRAEFKLIVFEVKNILMSLETKINGLEKDSFNHDLHSIHRFEDRIATRVSDFFSNNLNQYYSQMESSLVDLSPENLKEHYNFFQNSLSGLLYQSAYANRAFYKPRGYAGDFEMMNHVYKRELRGETLFAKCLQRYFVDEPAGKAVRNRVDYLNKKILSVVKENSGKKIKILSVASGPAVEIQNMLKFKNIDWSNIEFNLLDQDVEALKYAQKRILEEARANNIKINLKLHNLAIKNVIQEGLSETNYDLIYSAGLFDYFTDPVAKYAAQKLYQSLSNSGQLVIGNFSISNPNQFAMSLIMDWNLIYRSEDQMKKLFGDFSKEYKLEAEDQGINLFAVMKK